MKKYLLVFVLTVLGLGFSGCEITENNGTQMEIVELTVDTRDWRIEYDGDTPYFVCDKSAPEIDNTIFRRGSVMAYVYVRPGEQSEGLTPLPYPLEFLEVSPGGDHAWTETISWEYRPGYVTFYVQYSDFAISEDFRPGTKYFRLVLNW